MLMLHVQKLNCYEFWLVVEILDGLSGLGKSYTG